MKKKLTYITELTAEDVAEILQRGDVEAGQGITVEKTETGIRISIDKESIKYMLWAYVDQATSATNTVSLANLHNVQVDPG